MPYYLCVKCGDPGGYSSRARETRAVLLAWRSVWTYQLGEGDPCGPGDPCGHTSRAREIRAVIPARRRRSVRSCECVNYGDRFGNTSRAMGILAVQWRSVRSDLVIRVTSPCGHIIERYGY